MEKNLIGREFGEEGFREKVGFEVVKGSVCFKKCDVYGDYCRVLLKWLILFFSFIN